MRIFVETYRAAVAPADCDHLGDMNVQHYFAAVSDGMFGLMVQLGLGPDESAIPGDIRAAAVQLIGELS